MVLAAGLGVRMRPLNGPDAEAAGPRGGPHAARSCARQARRRRRQRSRRHVHYLPDQIIDHTAARSRPRVIISDERDRVLGTGGGVVKALPLLAPAVFSRQCRTCGSMACGPIWRGWPKPSTRAMDILLLMAPRRAASVMADAATTRCCRWRAAQAQGTSGGSIRLCRCGDHVAVAVRRCAGGEFSLTRCSIAPTSRAAVRP